MRKLVFKIMFLLLVITCARSEANIFHFFVQDLSEPSTIENFHVEFIVADDFSYINDTLQLGPAIPSGGSGLVPWTFSDPNPEPDNGLFIVDAFNGDLFDPYVPDIYDSGDSQYTQNNLHSGEWFSFQYIGTIEDIAYISFGDSVGNTFSPAEFNLHLRNLGPSGAEFSKSNIVPLPPSALLLMAGLVGMATIKRKNN